MKKLFFIVVILVLTLSIAIPTAIAADSSTVVSNTGVQIIGVYNEVGHISHYVDLSGSPLNAVIAAEPKPYPTIYTVGALDSLWDTDLIPSKYFQDTNPGADWIWETTLAEGPASYDQISLYDDDASTNGRVVVFQKSFDVSGTPQSAILHIAADNCYEVYINDQLVGRSATCVAGWETSNLDQNHVNTTGWQTIGQYDVESYLFNGPNNKIKILAGNEYYAANDGNSPVPAYQPPSTQYNPGGLIFKLDLETSPPPLPELPAGLLFGLGLLGVGGFILIRRKRVAAAK